MISGKLLAKQLDKFLESDTNKSRSIQSTEEASNEIIKNIKARTVIIVISNADFDGLSQNIIHKLQNG